MKHNQKQAYSVMIVTNSEAKASVRKWSRGMKNEPQSVSIKHI